MDPLASAMAARTGVDLRSAAAAAALVPRAVALSVFTHAAAPADTAPGPDVDAAAEADLLRELLVDVVLSALAYPTHADSFDWTAELDPAVALAASIAEAEAAMGGAGLAEAEAAMGGAGLAEAEATMGGAGLAEAEATVGGAGLAEAEAAVGGAGLAEAEAAMGGAGLAEAEATMAGTDIGVQGAESTPGQGMHEPVGPSVAGLHKADVAGPSRPGTEGRPAGLGVLLAASHTCDVLRQPWFLVADAPRQRVVLVVRGSTVPFDLLTDARCGRNRGGWPGCGCGVWMDA
eukprot:363197-Chlamydomonas_euryale.AAC.12